jgi:hypothetical protein
VVAALARRSSHRPRNTAQKPNGSGNARRAPYAAARSHILDVGSKPTLGQFSGSELHFNRVDWANRGLRHLRRRRTRDDT